MGGRGLAIACGALTAASCAPAYGNARTSLRIPFPAAGHVTLETLTVTVRGPAGTLPRRLRFSPQRFKHLPRSVRVVVGSRVSRSRRRTRFQVLVLAINQARPSARRAPGPGGPRPPPKDQLVELLARGSAADTQLLLLFMGTPVAPVEFEQSGDAQGGKVPDGSVVSADAEAAANADLGPAGVVPFGPAATELFGSQEDQPLDPNVDTGHYDDGHAFGWGVKGRRETADLLRDAFEASLDELIATIEHDIAADVNGDGRVSAGIDTTTGPVTCTPSPC